MRVNNSYQENCTLRDIDITLNNNLMPFIGMIYGLYLLINTILFITGSIQQGRQNTAGRPEHILENLHARFLLKGIIILCTSFLFFQLLEKKTGMNFLYIASVFFLLITICGEIFIELVINIFLPIVLSLLPRSKIQSIFFAGEISRKDMKISLIILCYTSASLFMFWSIAAK